MARNSSRLLIFLAAAALLAAAPAAAQFSGLTLPPDGDNQYASVAQGIGLVRITITYNSPDVHDPAGGDRRGKVWGELVPYGMANLGFGTCGDQCPWRGGANQNTVFTTTHDVKVQGQPLPAGSYGLHFLPGPQEWTLIFSKNYTSWGSFFYDAKEDALRVTAKPEKSEYHEWLTYEFSDRKPDRATVALKWEDLQVPFTVTVENIADLYLEQIRRDLRTDVGFNWLGWTQAARYALSNKKNPEEALRWAQEGVNNQETFASLSTLADAQAANGKADEAKKTMEKAINNPVAAPIEIHGYARQLIAQGRLEEALKVFEVNAKRHPDVWFVHLGLARGHAALGHKKEALEHARVAKEKASTDGDRRNVDMVIKQIEEGK